MSDHHRSSSSQAHNKANNNKNPPTTTAANNNNRQRPTDNRPAWMTAQNPSIDNAVNDVLGFIEELGEISNENEKNQIDELYGDLVDAPFPSTTISTTTNPTKSSKKRGYANANSTTTFDTPSSASKYARDDEGNLQAIEICDLKGITEVMLVSTLKIEQQDESKIPLAMTLKMHTTGSTSSAFLLFATYKKLFNFLVNSTHDDDSRGPVLKVCLGSDDDDGDEDNDKLRGERHLPLKVALLDPALQEAIFNPQQQPKSTSTSTTTQKHSKKENGEVEIPPNFHLHSSKYKLLPNGYFHDSLSGYMFDINSNTYFNHVYDSTMWWGFGSDGSFDRIRVIGGGDGGEKKEGKSEVVVKSTVPPTFSNSQASNKKPKISISLGGIKKKSASSSTTPALTAEQAFQPSTDPDGMNSIKKHAKNLEVWSKRRYEDVALQSSKEEEMAASNNVMRSQVAQLSNTLETTAAATPTPTPTPLASSILSSSSTTTTAQQSIVCLLCKKKFTDQAILAKHIAKSELHAENLRKANSSSGVVDKSVKVEWVDKNKERKAIFGVDPSTKKEKVQPSQQQRQQQQQQQQQQHRKTTQQQQQQQQNSSNNKGQVKEAKPRSEENIGSKMYAAMLAKSSTTSIAEQQPNHPQPPKESEMLGELRKDYDKIERLVERGSKSSGGSGGGGGGGGGGGRKYHGYDNNNKGYNKK